MQHVFKHENPCCRIFKRLVILIDRKIDVRIWENEGAINRNVQKVIPKSYLQSSLSCKFSHLNSFFWSPTIRMALECFMNESSIAFYLFNSPICDLFQSSRSFMFKILPSNPNFISLLHWKNFLMESLIMFCLFSYCALDPFEPPTFWHFEFFPQTLISFHPTLWKLLDGELNRALSFQFSYLSFPSKLQLLGVPDSSPKP